MKSFLTILMFLQASLAFSGGVPNVIIEPESPVAGESIDVRVQKLSCSRPSTPSEYITDIQNNDINIFVRFFDGFCPDPPPPQFNYSLGAELNGLEPGSYNLRYYSVNEADAFPPLQADYPSYFVEGIQFQVSGASEPTSVNATSPTGVLTLMLLMFGVGFVVLKKH